MALENPVNLLEENGAAPYVDGNGGEPGSRPERGAAWAKHLNANFPGQKGRQRLRRMVCQLTKAADEENARKGKLP